jgi:hypothetical protein
MLGKAPGAVAERLERRLACSHAIWIWKSFPGNDPGNVQIQEIWMLF